MASAAGHKAVVLAAGEGTRLRPLTEDRPKPMVPLAGRPALELLFGWLRFHGINDVLVNLHYKPESIIQHFGDGSDFGLRLTYFPETEIMGTAGGVGRMRDQLNDTFFVLYGDVLSDLDLSELFRFHRKLGAAATIALYRVEDPWNRGVVDLDERGFVTRFREKPPREECGDVQVNSGYYILEPEVLDLISPDTKFDFGHDVFPLMLSSGIPIAAMESSAYVLDYGSLSEYRKVDEDLRSGRWRPPYA